MKTDSVNLGPLEHLCGTWNNQDIPYSTPPMGGPANPYSYNVMPLPEDGGNDGRDYILKNFTYFEEITFNGPNALTAPAQAPNRGGTYQQTPNALFYDQQVKFAEGPTKGMVVHEENGAWLHLITEVQKSGPYGMQGQESGPVIPQPADMTLCKQISVPHGNSILSLGSFDSGNGKPTIPDAPAPFPTPQTPDFIEPYKELLNQPNNFQNPQPDLTLEPNKPIQDALKAINSSQFIHLHVTTAELSGGQGIVTNIPFEIRKAEVTCYHADYWILGNGGKYNYLLYTQTIDMKITIDGVPHNFPHVTCNALTKK